MALAAHGALALPPAREGPRGCSRAETLPGLRFCLPQTPAKELAASSASSSSVAGRSQHGVVSWAFPTRHSWMSEPLAGFAVKHHHYFSRIVLFLPQPSRSHQLSPVQSVLLLSPAHSCSQQLHSVQCLTQGYKAWAADLNKKVKGRKVCFRQGKPL